MINALFGTVITVITIGALVIFATLTQSRIYKWLVVDSYDGGFMVRQAKVHWQYLWGTRSKSFPIRRRNGEKYWFDQDGARIGTLTHPAIERAEERLDAQELFEL